MGYNRDVIVECSLTLGRRRTRSESFKKFLFLAKYQEIIMEWKKIDSERLFRSRCVVFDLDGTLCDTEADIVQSLQEALHQSGLAVADGNAVRIGPPLDTMIRSAVGENVEPAIIQQIADTFRHIYKRSDFPSSPLYPGAWELVHQLKAAKIFLAVATLKRDEPTKRLLEKREILSLFDATYSCDSGGESWTKERMLQTIMTAANAAPQEAMFFGDSTVDILAGRNVGVATVAALYGYGDKQELFESLPDFYCENLTDIRLSPENTIPGIRNITVIPLAPGTPQG